jgi:hypothetical protein
MVGERSETVKLVPSGKCLPRGSCRAPVAALEYVEAPSHRSSFLLAPTWRGNFLTTPSERYGLLMVSMVVTSG